MIEFHYPKSESATIDLTATTKEKFDELLSDITSLDESPDIQALMEHARLLGERFVRLPAPTGSIGIDLKDENRLVLVFLAGNKGGDMEPEPWLRDAIANSYKTGIDAINHVRDTIIDGLEREAERILYLIQRRISGEV